MTAPLPADALLGAETSAARPVAFDGLFGWLAPGVGRRGVLLCGAQGFDRLSAHRAWRGLAERIAGAGCTTLRFDDPGEGDSSDAGAEGLAGRLAAIRRAVRFLREEAGAEEIVLVGLRLGATLAALAAESADVDRLVLLAPFATGRACLRELTLQSRTVGRLPDGSPLPLDPNALDVGGFRIAPGLAADLARVDLKTMARAPAPRILLVGAEATGLAGRYAALGAAVEALPFPGLAQLVANPLFAVAPEAAFAAATAFAADGLRPVLAVARPLPPARVAGPGWREEAARFGADPARPDLFGILCRPDLPPAGAPVVLFVSAGTNVRSGWGRRTTALARRLAAGGVASLRMDLRGIGDSAERPDGASPLYNRAAVEDVRAGVDLLEARGLGPIVLVGACSGAFLGFDAACREPRVRAALLVNAYRLAWRADDDLDEILRGGVRSAATYVRLMGRGDVWRRALRGEIRFGRIAAGLARRARAALLRRLARLARAFRSDTVARRADALRRRGALLRLVYSAGDAGLAEFHEQFGRDPARAARRLGSALGIIPDADHDLSTDAAQDRLAAHLDDLLGTLRERHAGPMPPRS